MKYRAGTAIAVPCLQRNQNSDEKEGNVMGLARTTGVFLRGGRDS
jgi:hypothetical protein